MGECGGVGFVEGGGGGAEEREVEHEVSDGEVGGRAGEVQGQGYVVGLEGGEGCGEGGCAVGWAIAAVFHGCLVLESVGAPSAQEKYS